MFWDYIKITDISPCELETAYAELHPTRKKHIDSFKREEDRLCSLGGEILIKRMLKKYYSMEKPVIKRDERGKPYIENSQICISISHCDRIVACAVHTAPVGIDIERIRPVKDALISRVCTAEEQAYLAAAKDDTEGLFRFFEIWTAKEAYFKKQGTGITDFKSVNILNLNRNMSRIGDYLIQTVE